MCIRDRFQAVFQQPEPGRWLNLDFVIYEASEELPVVIPQDAAIEQWEAEGWQDVRFFSLDTPTGKDYTLLAYRPLPQPLENRYFIRDLGRAVDGGLPKARTLERCVLCVTLSLSLIHIYAAAGIRSTAADDAVLQLDLAADYIQIHATARSGGCTVTDRTARHDERAAFYRHATAIGDPAARGSAAVDRSARHGKGDVYKRQTAWRWPACPPR